MDMGMDKDKGIFFAPGGGGNGKMVLGVSYCLIWYFRYFRYRRLVLLLNLSLQFSTG